MSYYNDFDDYLDYGPFLAGGEGEPVAPVTSPPSVTPPTPPVTSPVAKAPQLPKAKFKFNLETFLYVTIGVLAVVCIILAYMVVKSRMAAARAKANAEEAFTNAQIKAQEEAQKRAHARKQKMILEHAQSWNRYQPSLPPIPPPPTHPVLRGGSDSSAVYINEEAMDQVGGVSPGLAWIL